MSTNATAGQESPATDPDCTDLDDRDVRALTERMAVLPDDGDDLHTVVGCHAGGEYTVDARTGACTCPDAEYRAPAGGCKHARRVAFATGERAIPAGVDRDAVDDLLGTHLDATPRFAATDGGVDTADHPDAKGRDEIHRDANWTACPECEGDMPVDYDECLFCGTALEGEEADR